jgi:serine/threonine-protein kinase HipA
MTSDTTLFVWNALPAAWPPVVAGKLVLSRGPSGTVGAFVYGKSYLDRAQAPAIDPVALPRSAATQVFTSLNGIPGAILDACPDKWGIRVLNRLLGEGAYPLDYLLLNDPGRAGSLAFSLSATTPPVELSSREFSLEALLHAAEDVEAERDVEPELLKALSPGTGGARPKCNLIDAGSVWIAKFPSAADSASLSIPRLEHATMNLGRACGIDTAKTRCELVDGRDVCLVERFDRQVVGGQIYRRGYVSARTVFYADPGFASLGQGSYGRFARWMTRYGCPSAERLELFRRMVFNCAVRNSDDHDLNHGLVQLGNGSFQLAKAFDVLPVLQPHRVHRHALLIGDSANGTVENLVSNAAAFGLSHTDALEVCHEIQRAVQAHWHEVFYEAGFDDAALRRLEPYFQPIPERA